MANSFDVNVITPAHWVKILDTGFTEKLTHDKETESITAVIDFLAVCIFKLFTYESEINAILVRQTLSVCQALVDDCTHEYVKQSPNHLLTYATVLHMPFLCNRVEWGESILDACLCDCQYFISNITVGTMETDALDFNDEGWTAFVTGVLLFAQKWIVA